MMTKEQMERYLESFDEDEEVDLSQEALNRFLDAEQEHAEALREELIERALNSPGCAQEDIIEMYRREF